MEKPIIKKDSNQEIQKPQILIDINPESLEGKNQNDHTLNKTILPKTSNQQSPLLMSVNSLCEPVKKFVIEEAFLDLKKTINHDFLYHFNLKILLKVFKGLIARQLLEQSLNQLSITKANVAGDLGDSNQFGLKFDALLVEDKKSIVCHLKTQPPKDRVFIIRKTKWDYLKRECKKNTGRVPDYLFFIQIFKNSLDDLFRNYESRNLEENLSILEEWVSNYSGNYSAEILGYLNGVDVEKLTDSCILQPEGLTLNKPSFWCYANDSCLKPISDFCVR